MDIRESNISKIFKITTNNHSLPQPQQEIQPTDNQDEEIKMRINLPYFEGTSERYYGLYLNPKHFA